MPDSTSQDKQQTKAATPAVDLRRLNRNLRHRLRNFCAGAGMAYSHLAQTSSEDTLSQDYISALFGELDSLQEFSWRMDLLVDPLPDAKKLSLQACLDQLAGGLTTRYPYHAVSYACDVAKATDIRTGSWLLIALRELVHNAADEVSRETELTLHIDQPTPGSVRFSLSNPAAPREKLPLHPPQAFLSTRGGHDGIGLAIAWRLATTANATLKLSQTSQQFCAHLLWPTV